MIGLVCCQVSSTKNKALPSSSSRLSRLLAGNMLEAIYSYCLVVVHTTTITIIISYCGLLPSIMILYALRTM